jgi:hypothetical protein
LRHRGSGIITKREPRRGERGFAPVPLEEPDADLLLKCSYLKAQSRLAEMNQLGGTTEVQSLCYREKRSNLTKFHLAILFAGLITDNKTNNVTHQRFAVSNEVAPTRQEVSTPGGTQ